MIAARFLAALAPGENSFTFQTFDDNGERKDARLAQIFHGTLEQHLSVLTALNEAGAGVFVTVNRTDLRGRTKGNMIGLRALFVDSDTGMIPLERFRLPPSARVATKNGEHAYWFLQEDEPIELFTDAQKQLIAHFQSDPSINDITRVLRVPGFLHCKDAAILIEHVWYGDPTRYTIDEILLHYPKAKVATPLPSPRAPGAPVGEHSGRNVHLTSRAGVLRASGLGEELLLAALRHENALLSDPLDDREVRTICHSVAKYETKVTEPDMLEALTEIAEATEAARVATRKTRAATIVTAPAFPELGPNGRGTDGRWLRKLVRDAEDNPKPGLGNVNIILENHEAWRDVLGFDTRAIVPCFMRRPPIALREDAAPANGAPLSAAYPRAILPHEISSIASWFTEFQRMGTLQSHVLSEAILSVSRQHEFDPVQDYLDDLVTRGVWDNVERLETILIKYCGAKDTPYVRAVTKRWMIQAVARALNPGCIARSVLILEGNQEIGKSTFFKRLFSPAFYAEDLPASLDKDAKQFCHGPWGIELAELAATALRQVEAVKAFVSLAEDRFRPPYGRAQETFRRGCVFGGTTNAKQYLRDETGNTRFHPVECGEEPIDHAGIERDRDLLWAEAVYWYDHPDRVEVSWLTKEEKPLAEAEQEARLESDEVLQARIAKALAEGVKSGGFDFLGGSPSPWAIPPGVDSVTLLDVVTYVLPEVREGTNARPLQTRIGIILTRVLGWSVRRVREHGVLTRRYYRPGCVPAESEVA